MKNSLCLVRLVTFLALGFIGSADVVAKQPNIIIMMVDDLGYSDFGCYGGGINSPMIAHWPAGLKTAAGSITHQGAHIIDFMATCIDLAGAEYPKTWPGMELEPLQGRSLGPILEGNKRESHSSLFFRFRGNRAIIQGDWKLVTHRASQWELYNLAKDGTELNNLASQYPEKVAALSKLWHQQATEQGRLKGKNVAPVSGKTPPLLKKSGVPAVGSGNKGRKSEGKR